MLSARLRDLLVDAGHRFSPRLSGCCSYLHAAIRGGLHSAGCGWGRLRRDLLLLGVLRPHALFLRIASAGQPLGGVSLYLFSKHSISPVHTPYCLRRALRPCSSRCRHQYQVLLRGRPQSFVPHFCTLHSSYTNTSTAPAWGGRSILAPVASCLGAQVSFTKESAGLRVCAATTSHTYRVFFYRHTLEQTS